MKNKKLTVIIIACVALVLTFILLTSYAYWRVQQTQTGTNEIQGACLDIRLEQYYDENNNLIEGFTLDNAWPISDTEGLSGQGYHFKVINTCEEDVTYQVVLDSLQTENPMNTEFVKVAIDNGSVRKYSELTDVTTEDELEYSPVASKVVYTGQIPGSKNNTVGEIEHTIKLWISSDSPNDEIGKDFSSKVRVVAGQQLPVQEYALTPASCFEFDESTGTITGYDQENCTTDYLVVPQKINGVMVKSIGESAFHSIAWNYVDLTKATGLEVIDYSAFYYYIGTNQELIIPNSVTTIGNNAFDHYNGSKLTLGNSVDTIGASAFQNYYGFDQELVIPNSVTEIGVTSFRMFNGSKLTLGNGVKIIDGSAFYSYRGIDQELVIPDSVTTIRSSAFANYNGPKLTLGNNVETISSDAFYYYYGINEELIIPDSVETIGSGSFHGYNGSKLVLGVSTKIIEQYAFFSYVGTDQELVIPDSVTNIRKGAFTRYNGSKLTIGSSVETIGESAFWSYVGTFYINMSEADFANVSVSDDSLRNASLSFLQQ